MSTRTSFRPRPLDTTRQLTIVRDVAELDSTDGLDATGVTAAPPGDGQVRARQISEWFGHNQLARPGGPGQTLMRRAVLEQA
jgi:hypothetical protein